MGARRGPLLAERAIACLSRRRDRSGFWLLATLILSLFPGLYGGQHFATAAELRPSTNAALTKLDAAQLAAHIDRALDADWAESKTTPAPAATDEEFVRRVYLDLVGKIPTVAEVRDFLADKNPNKRSALVDNLLQRGAHATHFGNVWRELMLASSNAGLAARGLAPQFDAWLRLRFAANTPYDQMVRELLTAPAADRQLDPRQANSRAPSPLAFYQANENKPENLAASTSRIFLGVQVQCAQCHDHPTANWTRREFWSLAAFFSGLAAPIDPTVAPDSDDKPAEVMANGIKIPETDIVVEAAFLDGGKPQWQKGEARRNSLAGWITAADNPYFARAAVNRLWEHFFGRGLVHPVDNFDKSNPPIHPELFDELGRQFAAHNYDLKYMTRALTATKAYQLSSRAAAANDDDLVHYARIPLRRMTADQLFDSIVVATGYREPAPDRNDFLGGSSVRAQFLLKFADQGTVRTEGDTSILQALSMMNGKLVNGALDVSTSETLTAVAESPFLDTTARVETLFLATLSRRPTAEESTEFVKFVDGVNADAAKAAANDRRESRPRLADVYWALLNSAEFVLNH